MANSSKLLRGLGVVAALMTGVLLGASARAADDAPNLLDDPFALSLGTFIFKSDLTARLDGDLGPGTPIDWESTFGGGDFTRFRLDGHWRFGDSGRHKARFMWFSASQRNSLTLQEDIEFGGEIYPVDAKINSEFGFDIYELAYEYAFLKRETYELDGSIGLHLMSLGMALNAKASTPGVGGVSGDIRRKGTLDAPLPVIGLRGIWQLPRNFWVDAGVQVFSANIDQYDGSLQDYRVMVNWQPKKWLGLGFGYNQFNVDLKVDGDNFKGNVNWKYKGPMVSYTAVF